MLSSQEVATEFYRAFQKLDGNKMASLYAESATFSDPVFPNLSGVDVGRMWRMLCGRSKELNIQFKIVDASSDSVNIQWIATYRFGPSERYVRNSIHARMVVQNGKIVQHHDQFNFWIWAQQALGLLGLLLGWSPFIRNKVQSQAAKSLAGFRD